MTLNCPRCRSSLRGEKHETGIAWRCAACGGQSLNFSQFRRLVPEPKANGIWETVMQRPKAPRRRSLCPECRRDMAAVLIALPDREFELDICRHCQRLWLDRQESIAGHLSEGIPPGPVPPAWNVSPAAQERMAGELAQRVRRRFGGGYELIGRLTVAVTIVYFAVRLALRWLN